MKLRQCDRCGVQEVENSSPVRNILPFVFGQSRGRELAPVLGAEWDLCARCAQDIERFMAYEELKGCE